MKWYVYEHKYTLGLSKNRKIKSLQTDLGKFMIRLFYYHGLFFVYVFDVDEDVAIDLDIFRTKNEALDFCEKAYSKITS